MISWIKVRKSFPALALAGWLVWFGLLAGLVWFAWLGLVGLVGWL